MNDYEALKAYGHSAAKAAEIILDANRGDFFSQRYLAFIRQTTIGAKRLAQ